MDFSEQWRWEYLELLLGLSLDHRSLLSHLDCSGLSLLRARSVERYLELADGYLQQILKAWLKAARQDLAIFTA